METLTKNPVNWIIHVEFQAKMGCAHGQRKKGHIGEYKDYSS